MFVERWNGGKRMANISTSTSCSVSFTDEEKKILQKASEICKTIGREIWHNGNDTDEEDQAAFFFSGIGGSIENALEGKYWAP